MAEIHPFAAYRYDLDKVAAEDVLTQPYDKITPEMRRRYLERSGYNFVRIILGERHSADNGTENVYTRAAGFLRSWIDDGVLRQDPEAAIYPYTQTFESPDDQRRLTRRGFIALGRLEDYDRRVVFRHEQTLTGPKEDRLKLLRATRAHFGQLFMLYSDPAQAVERELLARARSPILEARDEYGTEHRLYRETDAAVLARLEQAMAARSLIIADGHHRYETALRWRDEERARLTQVAEAPWDWAMMTFVNLDAPGLVILPTHRVVHSLPEWDRARIMARLETYFEAEERTLTPWERAWPALREELAAHAEDGRPAIAAILAGGAGGYLLRLRAEVNLERELPADPAAQRRLPVLLLHRLALERGLGIAPEDILQERFLRYERDARRACAEVAAGSAQAAFLLPPVTPRAMRDIALAGGVMPQKSTDFFPKLLSGLTIHCVG